MLAALLVSAAAPARTLTLAAARVHDAEMELRGVRVRIDEAGDSVSLELAAESIAVPRLGLAGGLEWRCTMPRNAGPRDAAVRECAGPVELRGEHGTQRASLALRAAGERIEIALGQGETRATVTIPLTAGAPYAVSGTSLPAAWLRAPLAASWPGGELRDGRFDVQAELQADGALDANYAIAGLALDSGDGTVGVAALDANGTVRTSSVDGNLRVAVDAQLRGGRLRLGALRTALPPTPVVASLAAGSRADGRWDVERFRWDDGDALAFEANGVLEPRALAPLETLELRLDRAVLPLAAGRYARELLAAQGLGRLALKGELAGELALDRDGVQRVALTTDSLDVDAGAGHSARGIHGGIDWSPRGERPPLALGWKALRVAGVAVPAASAHWQARDGALHLVDTLRAKLLGGEVRLARTVVHPLAVDGERLATRFDLRGVGYDSADGTLAAAGIAAEGELRVSGTNAQPRLALDARLHGGEALAGAFYVKLPSTPVGVRADASWDGHAVALRQFDWSDGDTLAFAARGAIEPAAAQPLRELQVDLREARLEAALGRYAQSWLASKGYAHLEGRGRLSGALHFDTEGLQRFAFDARDVGLRDGDGRFSFEGVDGGVGWDYRGATPATTLAWRAVELFRIPLGAAKASFESRHGAIVLAEPLAADVLGGQLRLEKLSLLPRSPRGERYSGSFAIVGLDMPRISAAFGWPKFPGSLSGGIPEIVMIGDTIEFRGGLDLYVFDGHLGVSGLVLERPFGVAPSLGADVHFQNFDLEQFTSAFSLGGMSGRLFGSIEGLRLLDWSPVALDAWLRTNGGGRLSYKAVDDITSLGGGGGLSNNLQTMALKVFDTFGYSRFGLRCRLTRETCLMGGIDPLPAGDVPRDSPDDRYTIIEGSGIPRLDIVGHRRRVDWPTLVRRVQESMQGQGPVIQ